MPSQYGESDIILQHFAGRCPFGRFLDVGAGDGLTLSNTLPLLAKGWSGVMVEPAPSSLRWLYENHKPGSRVEIAPFAIGLRCGPVEFWDGGQTGKEYSTVSAGHRERIEQASQGDVKFTKTRVLQMTWHGLLDLFPGPYDFINIDVEGTNPEVLAALPWDYLKPEMICVELDPISFIDSMRRDLRRGGLTHQTVCGGNLLAWR